MNIVSTMSRITTRERAKNSTLVTRINTLQSAARRPKIDRETRYVSERQASAANTEGRRADHSDKLLCPRREVAQLPNSYQRKKENRLIQARNEVVMRRNPIVK